MDLDAILELIEAALPWLETAALMTKTVWDDRVVKLLRHLLEFTEGRDWLATQATSITSFTSADQAPEPVRKSCLAAGFSTDELWAFLTTLLPVLRGFVRPSLRGAA